jgi:hypothetical protein
MTPRSSGLERGIKGSDERLVPKVTSLIPVPVGFYRLFAVVPLGRWVVGFFPIKMCGILSPQRIQPSWTYGVPYPSWMGS